MILSNFLLSANNYRYFLLNLCNVELEILENVDYYSATAMVQAMLVYI